MSDDLTVLLLGVEDEDLAGEVAEASGARVTCDAMSLARSDGPVVGIGGSPWPGWSSLHARARVVAAGRYTAVESWHRHPALIAALREAIARGRAEAGGDAHVLLTAPDPVARGLTPEERVFLREVVQEVAEGEAAGGVTIAWDHQLADGDPAAPTVTTVVERLADAHGRDRVVSCAVGPGTPPDPAAAAAASAVGIQLVQVAPEVDDLVRCLTAVIATLREHEGAA